MKEGGTNHGGKTKKKRDWKKILNKFDIQARFQKNSEKEYQICIEGWEDLDKLGKIFGLKLIKKIKIKEFNAIIMKGE